MAENKSTVSNNLVGRRVVVDYPGDVARDGPRAGERVYPATERRHFGVRGEVVIVDRDDDEAVILTVADEQGRLVQVYPFAITLIHPQ